MSKKHTVNSQWADAVYTAFILGEEASASMQTLLGGKHKSDVVGLMNYHLEKHGKEMAAKLLVKVKVALGRNAKAAGIEQEWTVGKGAKEERYSVKSPGAKRGRQATGKGKDEKATVIQVAEAGGEITYADVIGLVAQFAAGLGKEAREKLLDDLEDAVMQTVPHKEAA